MALVSRATGPALLGNPPNRHSRPNGASNCTACDLDLGHRASRDHHVRPAAVRLVPHAVRNVVGRRVQDDVAAEGQRLLQAILQRIDHHQLSRPRGPAQHRVQQSDRAGPVDDDRVAQFDPRHANPVDHAGERLQQRRFPVGDAIRQRNHVALRDEPRGDFDVRGMRPVAVDPERRVVGTVVGLPAHAGVAVATAGVGGHSDPLPDAIAFDARRRRAR